MEGTYLAVDLVAYQDLYQCRVGAHRKNEVGSSEVRLVGNSLEGERSRVLSSCIRHILLVEDEHRGSHDSPWEAKPAFCSRGAEVEDIHNHNEYLSLVGNDRNHLCKEDSLLQMEGSHGQDPDSHPHDDQVCVCIRMFTSKIFFRKRDMRLPTPVMCYLGIP